VTDKPGPAQRDPVLASLESMTGDPALAQAVKESLRTLTGGRAGTELAEMAREALAGRLDLRNIGRSTAYAEALTSQISQFASWYEQLDDEERERVTTEARERISAIEDEDKS
jgi:hypothetical protein